MHNGFKPDVLGGTGGVRRCLHSRRQQAGRRFAEGGQRHFDGGQPQHLGRRRIVPARDCRAARRPLPADFGQDAEGHGIIEGDEGSRPAPGLAATRLPPPWRAHADGVAVLNADEPKLVEMAELCDGEVLLYALSAENAALVSQRSQGGRAVFLRQGVAVLAQGRAETLGANIERLQARCTAAGLSLSADAALAAVATAWALGISSELISAGLDTFVPDLPQ